MTEETRQVLQQVGEVQLAAAVNSRANAIWHATRGDMAAAVNALNRAADSEAIAVQSDQAQEQASKEEPEAA